MRKWNEEAAPNNNLTTGQIKSSKLLESKDMKDHEFSEELSDGAERNANIKTFQNTKKG